MTRFLAMLVCVLACTGCASVSQMAGLSSKGPALHHELAAIVKAVPSTELSGYALRVYSQGQLVYSHDEGYAGAGYSRLIQEDTPFELASLSKVFTALAVMQLQERGLIGLNEPLGTYLLGLPSAWRAVTVHHLLSHQSGLPDLMNQWSRRRVNGLDFKALMAYFEQNEQLQFAPGSQAAYSNTNYIFLAELVAQVSGQDFGDYLQRHVFGPAGMLDSSVWSGYASNWFLQALPYAENKKIHEAEYSLIGAINQKSSAKDIEKFLTALLSHQLLRSESLDKMMQPHAVFKDGKRYGYGWYIGQLGGWAGMSSTKPAAGVGHTGRLGAYRTALYFNRERNFQLVMLSNGGIRTEKLLVDFLHKTRTMLE